MLTCRELIEFLDDYASGELRPDEKARFDEHLAVCPSCVAYLQQYDRTVGLGRGAFADGPADAAPSDLVDAILRSRLRR
jgi:anti-sigma factor RsiW